MPGTEESCQTIILLSLGKNMFPRCVEVATDLVCLRMANLPVCTESQVEFCDFSWTGFREIAHFSVGSY